MPQHHGTERGTGFDRKSVSTVVVWDTAFNYVGDPTEDTSVKLRWKRT